MTKVGQRVSLALGVGTVGRWAGQRATDIGPTEESFDSFVRGETDA